MRLAFHELLAWTSSAAVRRLLAKCYYDDDDEDGDVLRLNSQAREGFGFKQKILLATFVATLRKANDK